MSTCPDDRFLQEQLDAQRVCSSAESGMTEISQTVASIRVKSHWLGRCRRSEYIPVMILTNLAAKIFDTQIDPVLALIIALIVCCVFVIETIRRLHDMGHSGWWTFAFLIPLVGLWGWCRGQEGPNEYGPDPRA